MFTSSRVAYDDPEGGPWGPQETGWGSLVKQAAQIPCCKHGKAKKAWITLTPILGCQVRVLQKLPRAGRDDVPYLSKLKQLLPHLSQSTWRSTRVASRKRRTVSLLPKASACHSRLFDLTPVSPSSCFSSFPYGNQPFFADCKDLAGEQNLGHTWQSATPSQGTQESTITQETFQNHPDQNFLVFPCGNHRHGAQNMPFIFPFLSLFEVPLILSLSSVRETASMSRLNSFLSSKSFSDHPSWNRHISFRKTHCNYCYASCLILSWNSKMTCHYYKWTARSESIRTMSCICLQALTWNVLALLSIYTFLSLIFTLS